MRLAVFTNKYPARVATFFERDLRALIDAGVEVDVFPIAPLDPSLWQYSLDLLNDVLPRERIHHLSIGEALLGARPWSAKSLARFAGDATDILVSALRYGILPVAKSGYVLPKALTWARTHRERYDHVLAYWGNYSASCAYVFHRLTHPDVPFSIWLHAGADLYRDPVFLKEKLRYADNIVTCCEFNRTYIREQFEAVAPEVLDKVHVIYHGLNLADFEFVPGGRSPRKVLAVGRAVPQKGFDYLLRALQLIAERGEAFELELIGGGPELPALQALAADLGIADRVTFRGLLPFAEVKRAMRQATVLVHPSPALGDGLPNVLREAMAVGTPVIASDLAGIPEALGGGCGVLVTPKDVAGLAAAISRVLSDEPFRRQMVENARRRVETAFDLRHNGALLAELLRSTRREAGPREARAVRDEGAPMAALERAGS